METLVVKTELVALGYQLEREITDIKLYPRSVIAQRLQEILNHLRKLTVELK